MQSNRAGEFTEGDINIVEIWLRKDPTRWMAGAFAGIFAGLVMLGAAMAISVATGHEVWFPAKLPALPFLGNAATELGFNVKAIAAGLIVHELLCAFLGAVFAHFTGGNAPGALLGVGLTWGVFSWIFINNLFCHSFGNFYAAKISIGAAFLVHLVFGLSLASVAFFDRALRRS